MDACMHNGDEANSVADPLTRAGGRQILFYAPDGLLGGTFTCSRCGVSAHQPDVIDHVPDCSYGLAKGVCGGTA